MANLIEAIKSAASLDPDAPALLALGKTVLKYTEFTDLVSSTRQRLVQAGLQPGQRVALLLPPGPQAAVLFMAVASLSACCPVNPSLKSLEIKEYLAEAKVRLLITSSDFLAMAGLSLDGNGFAIWQMAIPSLAPAGSFELQGPDLGQAREPWQGTGDDQALILPTSGTTSKPKLVPLSQGNLLAAARALIDWYELSGRDRCLNLMPLFHVHGLIAGVLAPLLSGGGAICPRDWQQEGFVNLARKLKPTWYTAVPTIHQMVLASAQASAQGADFGLRFIRSCSAALSPSLMSRMEAFFHTPVLESYGMTEATLQITSNPLPPKQRKPGSVGPAAGCRFAVLDEAGNKLPPGAEGGVAIEGPSLTKGYEDRPEANRDSFQRGWFLTGDRGYVDSDGYLYLTGRAKEIIIRGGENIAPRLVDEALLLHPAVAEAVTFGVAHPSLGEEVAAAVRLKPGYTTSEVELKGYASQSLVPYQAPKRVLILPELPKGPTGKLIRIGLAEHLGLSAADLAAPEASIRKKIAFDSLESNLIELWSSLLENQGIGQEDNFFFSGGDSLAAVQLFAAIEEKWGVSLPGSAIYQAQTVREQVRLIRAAQNKQTLSSLLHLNGQDRKQPLFLVHAHDGEVLFYRDLIRCLSPDQAVFGLQALLDKDGLPFHSSMEEMAAHYLAKIRQRWPRDPYVIGGYCFGAMLAWEMARQLQSAGERTHLVLLDTYAPQDSKSAPQRHPLPRQFLLAFDVLTRLAGTLRYVTQLQNRRRLPYLLAWLRFHGQQFMQAWYTWQGKAMPQGFSNSAFSGKPTLDFLLPAYQPQPLPVDATLFRANWGALAQPQDGDWGWRSLVKGKLKVVKVPGIHGNLLHPPFNRALAQRVQQALRAWHSD